MSSSVWVALGLGSNQGERQEELQCACDFLKAHLHPLYASAVYTSPPLGFHSTNDFFNAVAVGKTRLSAESLLERCMLYEQSRGRKRLDAGYADRPIDLDLLFYGDKKVQTDKLTVPHPRWREREFVTIPLREVVLSRAMKEVDHGFPALPAIPKNPNVKKTLMQLCTSQ